MQSGEPYFGLTLPGSDARIPWEWRPDKALRSISALRTQYLGVDWLFSLVKKLHPITGHDLFIIQRFSALLWTLYVDVAIAFILPPKTARYVLCLFGISTAATTFLVRPFSNSLEAHQLALCFMQIVNFYRDRNWYRQGGLTGWYWGVLTSLMAVDGFFSRFTFAIFALPIGSFFVYQHLRIATEGYKGPAFRSLGIAIASLLVVVYLRIDTETKTYTGFSKTSGIELTTFWGTKWVIPPINALLYNLKTENVAQHGLHPRWLHALVNMPMIVGVANCVVLFVHARHFVLSRLSGSAQVAASNQKDAARASPGKDDKDGVITRKQEEEDERRAVEESIQTAAGGQIDAPGASNAEASSRRAPTSATPVAAPPQETEDDVEYVDIEPAAVGLSFAVIIFSLIILSISPHQEPRFLLPLAFPTTIIFAHALQHPYFTLRPKLTRTLVGLHIIQHILQLILFSFLHQAGLLPTLFSIDNSVSQLPFGDISLFDRYEHHLLYRTFSVPYHFLPRKGRGMFPRVEDYDSSNSLAYVMRMASITCNHTTLYAPAWVVPDLNAEAEWVGKVELWRIGRFGWHLDMDHLPETWAAVKEVGWREALAIQKLEVRCKTYPREEGTGGDVQVEQGQKQEQKQEVPPTQHEQQKEGHTRSHTDL